MFQYILFIDKVKGDCKIRKILHTSNNVSLTKVANSRYLYELADIEIDRSVRFGRPLTSAYIDIDNFKQVNDIFGHAEGDRLLRSVATTIKENIRAIDIIARVGGDEFFVLMSETGEEQAKTAISRVQKHLSDIVKMNKWPITFSIGVVVYNKPTICKIDDLIKNVDVLMYSVKTNGKNNVAYKTLDISTPVS